MGQTLSVDELEKELQKDPEFRKELAEIEAQRAEFVKAMVAARKKSGLSQAEVAKRMGTTQSVVARLESGAQKPSLHTVERFAAACSMRVKITLVPSVSSKKPAKRNAA